MQKLIIISHTMRMGGVERSLIGLLNSFDYTQYSVDLFLLLHDGEFMSLIPKEVHLLPQNKKYAGLISSVRDNLKWLNFAILFGKQKAKKQAGKYIQAHRLRTQNLVYDNYLQLCNLPCLPPISDKTYDLAISFLAPHYLAAQKVKARKKIAWIHTDYSFFDFDKKTESSMWEVYDYIASISPSCTQSFLQQFPGLKSKVIGIENILDTNFIRQQARAFSVEHEMPVRVGTYNLLSVGRFSHPKNFDNIPSICKKINQLGVSVIWYLIGYGSDASLIRQKIEEEGMQQKVILLGKKENPYPYMLACDLYVQPSRYEGKAVTVREAQVLAKPVVITNFPTSGSQLKNGYDGVIVPLDNEACAKGIVALLRDSQQRNLLTKNCLSTDFSNNQEIQKIYSLIPANLPKQE